MNNGEFQAHTEKLERALHQIEALPDEHARSTAHELMQSLMDLHGGVLSRLVEVLADSGETGARTLEELGDDPLVCGLLVLYGLHPFSLQERVNRAIERIRPQVQKQGATLTLASTRDWVVRVMVEMAVGRHAPSSLRLSIEQAIRAAAPEATEILIEGLQPSGFVPLNMIQPLMQEEKGYEESAA
jgi:Fe-S cluster biogenesis protein NfuA